MQKQEPGEYIQLYVSADGYKGQQEQLLVGENRKVSGGFGSIRTPSKTINFTLQSSTTPVTHTTPILLIVEVYDAQTYKVIPGASVKVTIINGGNVGASSTNNNGEANITVKEQGLLRVMVSHNGYKEKWSDIPAELTQHEQERRYTVYIEPNQKAEDVVNWSGTYTGSYWIFNLSGSGSTVSGSFSYSSGSAKGTGSLTNCKVNGNTVTGNWIAQHEDDTKTGTRKGTFTASLSSNNLTGHLLEDDPGAWSYKEKYSAANVFSSMKKGAVWAFDLLKK